MSRDPAANAARVAELVGAHPEADLAVFPELFLTGYQATGLAALAEEALPHVETVAVAARRSRTAVILGLPWAVGGGIANSALCISNTGGVAARYDKTHLFGVEMGAFEPGGKLVMVEIAGLRVAPLICFDLEFPEPARLEARAGAGLLVVIAANMRPYHREHRVFSQARALENRVPLVYVNRVGRESGFDFVGGSRVVDAEGIIRHQMSASREEVAVVEVPEQRPVALEVRYLRWARTDLEVPA